MFVWFRLVFIQLVIRFISIYPASTNIDEKMALFNINHFYSSSDYQTPILCQVSANYCGGYRISDVIYLLQRYLTIHYCNQSVLAIVPDLNIVVWSITFIISFQEVPWYITYLLSDIFIAWLWPRFYSAITYDNGDQRDTSLVWKQHCI